MSIHHTASLSRHNAKSPKRLKGYQRYHQRQGWADLAYHFFIDLKGNVYEGRRLTCAGDTFTQYDPAGHLLVVLDGNFENQKPTPEAIDALTTLLAWAAKTFNVPLKSLAGHRDLTATACPGHHLYQFIQNGNLLETIRLKMEAGAHAAPDTLDCRDTVCNNSGH